MPNDASGRRKVTHRSQTETARSNYTQKSREYLCECRKLDLNSNRGGGGGGGGVSLIMILQNPGNRGNDDEAAAVMRIGNDKGDGRIANGVSATNRDYGTPDCKSL